MTSPIELAIPGAIQVRNYAERLIKDIPVDKFASKPTVQGKTVETVHPAFIFGHLDLYPYRISSLLNLGAEELKPPTAYFELFSKDMKCENDPECKIYPHKDELTGFFLKKTDAVLEILKNVSPDKLYAENIEEKSKDRFPTVGSFVIYLLTTHPNGHFGQISVWRRCMGLGPV